MTPFVAFTSSAHGPSGRLDPPPMATNNKAYRPMIRPMILSMRAIITISIIRAATVCTTVSPTVPTLAFSLHSSKEDTTNTETNKGCDTIKNEPESKSLNSSDVNVNFDYDEEADFTIEMKPKPAKESVWMKPKLAKESVMMKAKPAKESGQNQVKIEMNSNPAKESDQNQVKDKIEIKPQSAKDEKNQEDQNQVKDEENNQEDQQEQVQFSNQQHKLHQGTDEQKLQQKSQQNSQQQEMQELEEKMVNLNLKAKKTWDTLTKAEIDTILSRPPSSKTGDTQILSGPPSSKTGNTQILSGPPSSKTGDTQKKSGKNEATGKKSEGDTMNLKSKKTWGTLTKATSSGARKYVPHMNAGQKAPQTLFSSGGSATNAGQKAPQTLFSSSGHGSMNHNMNDFGNPAKKQKTEKDATDKPSKKQTTKKKIAQTSFSSKKTVQTKLFHNVNSHDNKPVFGFSSNNHDNKPGFASSSGPFASSSGPFASSSGPFPGSGDFIGEFTITGGVSGNGQMNNGIMSMILGQMESNGMMGQMGQVQNNMMMPMGQMQSNNPMQSDNMMMGQSINMMQNNNNPMQFSSSQQSNSNPIQFSSNSNPIQFSSNSNPIQFSNGPIKFTPISESDIELMESDPNVFFDDPKFQGITYVSNEPFKKGECVVGSRLGNPSIKMQVVCRRAEEWEIDPITGEEYMTREAEWVDLADGKFYLQ
jgi:hypothetical protein